MKKKYFSSFHRITVLLIAVLLITAQDISANPPCVPPHQYNVTGGGSFCSGGTGVYVGLSYSDVGIMYQLYNGTTPVGSPLPGTGAPRTFGLQTAPGTYKVIATNPVTLCTSNMFGTPTIIVNSVAPITGTMSVCVGQTMTLSNSITGGTWSTFTNTEATVGLHTGIVTGVSASTPTIRYTLSTGCVSSVTVTVNALQPTGPVGTPQVCVGETTTLNNTTVGGGTWSSSNTTIATVATISGVTSGVAAGTTVISFTTPMGCITTKSVIVNPRVRITGDSTVCMGQTITLSNALTGGTWSTFAHTQATVDLHTGVVTGVITSTPAIMYTLPTGCVSILTITVNPLLPTRPVATPTVCQGQTITVTNSTPGGGTWSSSNTSIATVAIVSGVTTGVTVGTTVISYTTPLGCITTKSVTVNPRDSITGNISVCQGQTIMLSDALAGGTWSTFATNYVSVGAHTGIITGLEPSTPTVRYTNTSGCISTFVITVNALSPITPVGNPLNICKAQPITLIDNTLGGAWSSANTTIATVSSTTGVTTGVTPGTTVISYTTLMGCIATKSVTVNSKAPITGDSSVCMGQTVTLSDSLSGGVWSTFATNFISVGLNSGIVTGYETGTPTIRYTLPTGCVSTFVIFVKPLYQTTPINVPKVCLHGTLILVNATPGGGTWSTATAAIATVDSISGLTSGISLGNGVITFTSSLGCIATKTVTVIDCHITTGVNSTQDEANDIMLFPNPNNGTFTIKGTVTTSITAGGDADVSVEVLNILGQVIYKRTLQSQYGIINEQIQLDNTIPNSMYIVNVRSGTEQKAFHIVVEK